MRCLGTGREILHPLDLAEDRGVGQGKDHNLFAGGGADVVVQAQHLDAGDPLDQGFQGGLRRLDQMAPHLLQEVATLLVWKGLDQVLFGGGQDALEPDHKQVADQVGPDILGSPAHVILFEAADSFADGGFDFTLGFRGNLHLLFSPPPMLPEMTAVSMTEL
jgi:hypothetical protein